MESQKTNVKGINFSSILMPPFVVTLASISLFLIASILDGRIIDSEYIFQSFKLPFFALLSFTISVIYINLEIEISKNIRNLIFLSALSIIPLAANMISSEIFDNLFITVFFSVGAISLILSNKKLIGTNSIFLSVLMGLILGASYSTGNSLFEQSVTGNLVNIQREFIISSFFAFFFSSISLSFTSLIGIREFDKDEKMENFFSVFEKPSKNYTPILYSLIISIIFLIPLVWISQIDSLIQFSEDKHLSVTWAFFSTILVLIHAYFRSENWQVLGSMLAVSWILYTIGHIHEIGNTLPYPFDDPGFIGSASWAFIGFWMYVIAIMSASRGYFGDITPRKEFSDFRKWWNSNYYGILISLALFTALYVRTAWNVIPAMNASSTGIWDMTGGSDPWYMKRVIDYIIAERSHFIFDYDRAYPSGGVNPRPPLFSWSLALGGILISWILEIPTEEAVWWSISALPAIYGALIVIPLAGIATRVHSRSAGVVAAWLIALMPGHISRSTFAMADHDSFAMLFLATAFYFWVKALEKLEHKKLFESASSNPLYLIAGMRESWKRYPEVMANATLSGIAFTVMALGWKGFVYGPGILFLAYTFQVAMNIFRGRDSLLFTSASLQMMITATLLPLPFYAWPGLNLVFSASGMSPMFYIIGFTAAVGWVASSFRDKPWLLVIISGFSLFSIILGTLFLLQTAEIYSGWDILFTGGFYFSKNKIFGTIGEAQAPSRGLLFASYGPVVTLIAIGCSFILLWRGIRRNKSNSTFLGMWVIIATYMAWTAGRFIINATPAMSVVGGIGITMLWRSSNPLEFAKEWRRSGIGSPRSRFRSIWPATKSRPGVPAIILVLLLVTSQHTTYGIDSGIPRNSESSEDIDRNLYNLAPDIFREDFWFIPSLLNGKEYNQDTGLWYMGTFGPSFNSAGWNEAYEWLSEQDTEVGFSERPAFVSWWDYGFQALASGQHPTVSDNFQSGIPNSGGMLLSSGQEDTLAMFIATLAMGDQKYNDGNLGDEFTNSLLNHMSTEQVEEFVKISQNKDAQFVLDRSMSVFSEFNGVELLKGHPLDSRGIPSEEEVWVILQDGVRVEESTNNDSRAFSLYNETRQSSSSFEIGDPSHYDIGGYRYTTDLISDYYDVSTSLHRSNAKFGLLRSFLISAFEMDKLVNIYDDVSKIIYSVANYNDSPGNEIERNNEIRYFAVDNRLFPLGGSYYEDSQYHRGQTTGIFHAPTSLSGLDLDTYISTLYQTQRGDGPIIPRTQQQYEQEYLEDVVRQSSGASSDSSDVIRMIDIDYQHLPEFFETMVARTYVGYGSSTLGLPGDAETPSVWFNPDQTYVTGAPGSYLQNAFSLPGAMMNHFVISNWYDIEECEKDENGDKVKRNCGTIYDSYSENGGSVVKILKYYSGASIEGTVELSGNHPIPNARILIERDAFSGEEIPNENGEVIDSDPRTYWIPIGSTQADENGEYSFTAPAGKIRVSAFSGEPDLESARNSIISSNVGESMYELFIEKNTQTRSINPVTGILGNVFGSTWLSESIVNISGTDGHSNGEVKIDVPIYVTPSSASGILSWTGEPEYDGQPILDGRVILSPTSEEISITPYSLEISNGSITGEELEFNGFGQVTFTGEGTVKSGGIISVSDFTGNHTQKIYNNHSMTGEGIFSGKGKLNGQLIGASDIPSCVNESVPIGEEYCIIEANNYLINGTVLATGVFTSEGVSELTKSLTQATFLGSGDFEINTSNDLVSYGSFNGTGQFFGTGEFSGDMVQAGSFHLTNALPGDYNISVKFSDNSTIDLDQIFVVGDPQPQPSRVTVFGGSIKGLLQDSSGTIIDGVYYLLKNTDNITSATSECSANVTPSCYITPDEDGKFVVQPIIPGEYKLQTDLDNDGFPELSEQISVSSDALSSYEFINPIPHKSDITFTLSDDSDLDSNLNLIIRAENNSLEPVSPVYDEELDQYFAELTPGVWILNHTLTDNKQLWERIEIGNEDISTSFSFRVSQIVNGTLKYSSDIITDSPIQNIGGELIKFQWGDFSLSTVTDNQGSYSVILPRGVEVNATAQVAAGINGFFSNGSRFTVSEGISDQDIVLSEGVNVDGSVSINRPNNPYTSDLKGWEKVYVEATNTDLISEAIFREPVSPNGQFSLILPTGNWSFTLDTGNHQSNIVSADISEVKDLELIITPEFNSSVHISMFIDNDMDGNISNGTLVDFDFKIKSLQSNGSGLTVEVGGDAWTSRGKATVSLEPGSYQIIVERANSTAGDLFDTIYDLNDIFHVSMQNSEINHFVSFEPLFLTNFTLRNESSYKLIDQEVTLQNIENGWIRTFNTNQDGMISEYLKDGEWLVVVPDFESETDSFEGLRQLIQVSYNGIGPQEFNLQTKKLAEITIDFSQAYPLISDESVELEFSSQEDLGSIISSPAQISDGLFMRLTQGLWNVQLNSTDNQGIRLIIPNQSISNTGISSGQELSIELTINRFVEVSGRIYWDLNDDSNPDSGEGLSNVSVNMTLDSGENFNLKTDDLGHWSIFLPSNSVANYTVEKDGFESSNATLEIQNSALTRNTEISAGNVTVTGALKYISEDWIFEDDWTIELIPAQGIERDRVIPTKVQNQEGDWTGEWSASLEPGSWIVYAMINSPEEEPYLVSVEKLEVDINGGNIISRLSSGGMVYLDTTWIDYDGNIKTLLDVVDEGRDYELLLDIGMGISWSEKIDNNGVLEILLPAGRVDASGTFKVVQKNMEMTYSGGQGVNIRSGQDSPLTTLNIERISEHDIQISYSQEHTAESTLETICDEVCNYTSSVFSLEVIYQGNNPYDSYDVEGSVSGTDSENWEIEFWNSSANNGTGEWNSSVSIEMGLDNSLTIPDFKVRVTPGNQNNTHHLQFGHNIEVIFNSKQGGYSTKHSLSVKIPEFSNLEFDDDSLTVYFSPEDRTINVPVSFSNLGNSDETFFFEYSDHPEWTISGPQSQLTAPFSNGLNSLNLFYIGDSSAELKSEYYFDLSVSDDDNNTYSTQITLIRDTPTLSINGDSIQLQGGGRPVVGEISTYVVEVINHANVDATDITINATLYNDITGTEAAGIQISRVGSIPAKSSQTFYLPMNFENYTTPGKYSIIFDIDPPGYEPGVDKPQPCSGTENLLFCVKEAQLWSSSVDEDQNWLMWIFVLMLLIALITLTRRSGRRPGAPF